MKQEEKLEEAKRLYQTANADQRYVLESLFPELAESEDEKIRKTLIEMFSNVGKKDWRDIPTEKIIAWLEKQCEQKPTDKVEPKFKVGDWIIATDDEGNITIEKIIEFWGDKVRLVDTNGYYTLWPQHELNYYHLWTIQDAKDGDVLINWNNTTFIFKAIEDETVKFYIAYNEKYDAVKTPSTILSHLGLPEPQFEFHPATKEQRDTLMKAMADAGYTFDFEKKELKEIEDEEYDGEDYGIDSLYHAQRILEKTLGKVDGYQTDDGILSHKCAISAVKKLYEQKTYYSKEDEEMFDEVVNNLHNYIFKSDNTYSYIDCDKHITWLKSLKDRVQPQSQPAWSEEDEEELEIAIKTLHEAGQYSSANWLKSLKQRNL